MWLSPSGDFPLHVRVARTVLGEGTAVPGEPATYQVDRRRRCRVRCRTGEVWQEGDFFSTPTAWKAVFNTPSVA